MKSCLKCSAASSICPGPLPGPSASPPSSSSSQRPKWSRRVSFRDKREDEVHTADEWDRTPVDVVAKLTYEDVLELKEMQLAAAKACARATEAKGMTPKYLSNVPLGLLPLLPETSSAAVTTSPPTSPRSSSPPPQHSLSDLLSNGSVNGVQGPPAGLSLAEACMCRVFSADTGLPVTKEHGHHHVCGKERDYSSGSSSNVSSPSQTAKTDESWQSTGQPQFKLVSSVHQIPSPPDTPPRLSVTSIPPPPPTRKARQFAFLPLLDASSSSSSPMMSLTSSPIGSGMSSPSSPRNGAPIPPVSLSDSLSALCPKTSPPFSSPLSSASPASSSSPPPSNGAYTAYDPYGGSIRVGGNATLGLERRLGYKFESDSETSSGAVTSEEEGDDDGWPRDWPGRHPHTQRQHSSSARSHSHSHSHPRSNHVPLDQRSKDVKNGRDASGNDRQQSPSIPKFPPSPPTESNRPLPLYISPSISNTIPPNNTLIPKSFFSNPRDSASPPSSSSPRTSPSRKSSPSPCTVRRGVHTSSPSPPGSSSSTSSPRTRKSKMALPLVTLA